MVNRVPLALFILSSVAFAQRASPALTAPGQCECRCASPRLTLEPAPPVAQCSGVVPSADCACECKRQQTLPVNAERPSRSLTAKVAPLLRQGGVVVSPDVTIMGPRGAVFVLGASFRDDEPRAAWSPWVTTRRYAVGPTGHVNWESFMAEVPDDDFTTRRFQARLAVFDEAGRVVAEATKTLTARPANAALTLSDMQFDNAPDPAPAAVAPVPLSAQAADLIRRFATNSYSTQYSGPHPPGVPKAEQQMRHTLVAEFQLTPGAPDRPNGTLLLVRAWNPEGSQQGLAAGATVRYGISMAHCNAAMERDGKSSISRPGGASVEIISQSSPSDYSFIACAKEGTIAYTRTQEGQLYLAMDVVMTDGSRASQSFWVDPMSCRPNPPCF